MSKIKYYVLYNFKCMDRSSIDYGVLLERKVQFKTISKAKHFADNIPMYLEHNKLIGKPVIGTNGGSSNGRKHAFEA